MTYGTDAADSHLRMVIWELDGDLLAGDCSKLAELSNTGFLARWKHVKKVRRSTCMVAFTLTYVMFRNLLLMV